MKLSNEEWILKFSKRLNEEIYKWETFKKEADFYIKNIYPYKNTERYSSALYNFSIPNFFCLDVDNRTITYLHWGVFKKCQTTNGKVRFSVGKNRSTSSTLGNILALMNGKKQIAVNKIAQNRRRSDGSYTGTEKMHQTKIKNDVYRIASNKTAILRRKADGSYKGNDPKWTPELVIDLLKIKGLDYQYLETKNKGNKEKVRFICDNNHPFRMKINAIQSFGNRCPTCRESKGEYLSREIIEKITGLKFPKTRPNWLRNPKTKKLMELDGYCQEIKIAFEYDGPMHSEPIFGVRALKRYIKRDLIKNELCDKNDIKLIRISYKVKDIEKYLRERLEKVWLK